MTLLLAAGVNTKPKMRDSQMAKLDFAEDEAFMRLGQGRTNSILVLLFLAAFGSAHAQSFPGQGLGVLWTAPWKAVHVPPYSVVP